MSSEPRFHVGFRTSIITLCVGIVLFVGLALVYLSFVRVTSITRSAASSFLDTVAQLSADRIDAQLKTARESLDILRGLNSVQQKDIKDNPRLYIVLASMLRNNKQLYNLYMGYDDGSFLEMDFIDRAGDAGKSRLGAPDGAKFRLVIIAKAGDGGKPISSIHFLSDTLASISQHPGRTDFDPRSRPWFKDAYEPDAGLLTEPYVFFATGEAGYTVRVPKRLVQQLVETGNAMTLGGTRREVTILFTDVANFTGITEHRDPAQVMQFTSRYFAALSEAIMANNGTVDKFIGDAVMAIWNAPIEDDDHVANACAAVLACIEANRELNAEFEHEGWPAYHTRFGVHVGDVVVGNIGSSDRMNYTVLGAAVNLAARLEALNKQYQTTALVSEAVKQRVERRFVFRSVDRIKPKGFAAEAQVYELVGARAESGVRRGGLTVSGHGLPETISRQGGSDGGKTPGSTTVREVARAGTNSPGRPGLG